MNYLEHAANEFKAAAEENKELCSERASIQIKLETIDRALNESEERLRRARRLLAEAALSPSQAVSGLQ
jgi:predicted KAP-like P-loop ATPase